MRDRGLALALLISGCCMSGAAPLAPLPNPPSLLPAAPGELFTIATLRRSEGVPAPARLTAPPPSRLADLSAWPESAPPRAQLQARLCAGDRALMDAWLAAAATAARSAPPMDVAAAYADPLEYCPVRGVEALRASIDALPPGARETAMLALAYRGEDADEERMLASDTPPRITLAWFGGRSYAHPPTAPQASRLSSALVARLAEMGAAPYAFDTCGNVFSLVDDVTRLGELDALLTAYPRLSGGAADCLALGLGEVADLRAQAIFAAACPRVRSAAICAEHASPVPRAAAAAEPHADPTSTEFDAHAVSADPAARAPVVEALAECAARDDYGAPSCLRNLAVLDRARAVEVAGTWIAAHPDAENGDAYRTLHRFPEAGQFVGYLRDAGLLTEEDAGLPAVVDTLTAIEALMHAGRLASFDTETDQFPNEHDALLVELSLLAPTALPGVLFEEVVLGTPGGVDLGGGLIADGVETEDGELLGEDPEGNYLLRAYEGGARYDVDAENLGDWYDVDAVLGLLNALAVARGSDTRWLMLHTRDQTALVVAGPAEGLRRVVEDGWLLPEGRGASAAARDHEAEMIERMIREGAF